MITSGRSSVEVPPARATWSLLREVLLVSIPSAVLLAFFLFLYPLRGFRFPIGADAPVYLWWARLAVHDGLSAVGNRPGITTLTVVLGGTLGLSQPAVLAGIGAMLGTTTGLAGAALVDLGEDSRDRAARFVVGAMLVGTFAVHLADGYFANLAFATLFVAAAAVLAARTRAATVAATVTLGAAGLAHPLFWVVGAIILALTALPGVLRRGGGRRGSSSRDGPGPDEAAAIGRALLGGGAIAGAGLLALVPGPSPLRADTSKDAFLRRAGLTGPLRADYLDRFARHWARFVLPVSVPLATVGVLRARGFLGRFLRAWGVVMLAGVAGALATGLAPAVRFLSFGFVLPLGVAVALPVVWRALRRRGRLLAGLVSAAVIAAMLGGPTVTWLRTRPYLNAIEASRIAAAGRVAEASPPGTPLVFVVDNAESTVLFLATRAANVLRDAIPPDRIRDVYVYVGSPQDYLAGRPTLDGDEQHDALSRLYLQDIRSAGGRPVAFLLAPFNRPGLAFARQRGTLVSRGVFVLPPGRPEAGSGVGFTASASAPVARGPREFEPVRPTSSWWLVTAAVLCFVLLAAVGLGWALVAVPGLRTALALAPALGVAALILGGIVAERVGVPLSGAGPPVVSAVVGAGGYAVALRWRRRGLERQALPDPPAQVDQ